MSKKIMDHLPEDLVTKLILLDLPEEDILDIPKELVTKMEDLPKELVVSILLRLPNEDVLRCKSVCKLLNSIIRSRSFIDAVSQKIRKNSYILVKYQDRISNYDVISLLSDETLEVVDCQPVLSDTPVMDSMMISKDYVTVVGCCNGVVCLRCIPPHDEYVLWNPATRDAKLIPDGLYKSNPDKKMLFRHQNMGFGFDSKSNDYKLVSIQRLYENNPPFSPVRPCQQEVEVYSLKTGCWKLLPNIIPTSDMMLAEGCSGGGEMFSWLVWNEEYGEHVLSFDMSNEIFITTPLHPCMSESRHGCTNKLILHNTSLALDNCVRDENNNTETSNIWVLGEYGVEQSWTNLFTVGPLEPRIKSIRGFWNNNKVLLQVHGGGSYEDLILVDPSIQKIKDVDISARRSIQVFNYQESLVQINASPPINLI